MHIHIYAVEAVTGPSLGVFKVSNWSKFVFCQSIVCQKHYKIGGFSPFLNKQLRAQIFKVSNWPKLAFCLDPQLGPVTDFDLDQLLTLKMFVGVFLLLKMCSNTSFYSVF